MMLGSRALRSGWSSMGGSVPVALALLALCGCTSALTRSRACPRPPVPKYGGFRCSFGCPPVHDGKLFGGGSVVEYYCEGGYTLGSPVVTALCSLGKWNLREEVICRPSPEPGYVDAHPSPVTSIPLVAAVAFTVSGLLLIAMVCILVKPKHRSCQCSSGDYSRMVEPDFLSEDGCPLPLPSYEEAVYGPQGRPLPSTLSQAPLPFILAEGHPVQQEPPAGHQPDAAPHCAGGCMPPPPSYEEIQAAARDTACYGSALTLQSTPLPSPLSWGCTRQIEGLLD